VFLFFQQVQEFLQTGDATDAFGQVALWTEPDQKQDQIAPGNMGHWMSPAFSAAFRIAPERLREFYTGCLTEFKLFFCDRRAATMVLGSLSFAQGRRSSAPPGLFNTLAAMIARCSLKAYGR
jgi:hypothetical protein